MWRNLAPLACAASLGLGLSATACNGRSGAVVPPGPLRTDPVRFELAVYYTPAPAGDPEARLYALLAHDLPLLRPVRELPAAKRGRFLSARRERDVQGSYRPPDLEGLRYCGRGLTAAQSVAVQSSGEALVMDFLIRGEPPWKGLRTACEVAGRIARETGGLLWDEETRELFTPAAWDRERLASWTAEIPDVARQTTIHLYRKREAGNALRAVTLGMAKLGLPDVAVEGFSKSSARSVASLVNSLGQALAEGAKVGRDGEITLRLRDLQNRAVREREIESLASGALGEARLRLLAARREPGDAENRLIAISPDRYPGPDRSARIASLLAALFGFEDHPQLAPHDDPELLAASRAARARLPALRRAFEAGLAPAESILVKAPFESAAGKEWMWVEVTAWRRGEIAGTLENEPTLAKQLRAGQRVTVAEDEVFDYLHRFPDGRQEGNTTGAVLERRSGR